MKNKQNHDTVVAAIRKNPLLSDMALADQCGVSKFLIHQLRKEHGLWTSQRIRHVKGKPQLYRVKRPDTIKDEQSLIPSLKTIDDTLIKRLSALSETESGQELLSIINDILDIAEQG